MIRSVRIRNFKNLLDVRGDLERLTLFVGANGSGKSSVLQAIQCAERAAHPNLSPIHIASSNLGDFHCDWLYSRAGTGFLSIEIETPGGTLRAYARVDGEVPTGDRLGSGRWSVQVDCPPSDGLPQSLQSLGSVVYLNLNSRQLGQASYSDSNSPRIDSSGVGLASTLAYMKLNDPDSFQELESFMRELIPTLERIRFRKAQVLRLETEFLDTGSGRFERRTERGYQGDAILFDYTNAKDVAAETVSEGTLMLLGLLTVILGPERPNVLLIDDIEHGLHPSAQKTLFEVLRRVMASFPNLQILATAHSPYLLDHVDPEEIRLMAIGDDGYAVCGKLTDHPEFERWKDEMASGELWSLFGEKWVVKSGTAS